MSSWSQKPSKLAEGRALKGTTTRAHRPAGTAPPSMNESSGALAIGVPPERSAKRSFWCPSEPPLIANWTVADRVVSIPESRWKKSAAQPSGSKETAALPRFTTLVCARLRAAQLQSTKPFWSWAS